MTLYVISVILAVSLALTWQHIRKCVNTSGQVGDPLREQHLLLTSSNNLRQYHKQQLQQQQEQH